MAAPPVGTVVLVLFPFADFSGYKKRPALVVAHAEMDCLVLCRITSNASISKHAIKLTDDDLSRGSLKITSYIRPDKLFTIDQTLVASVLGSLKPAKINTVKTSVRSLFE